uniref:FBA domain-containing protein n=1 Tax=Balaenoptera musculus TaxID=9771 RepID=A0A8C0HY47_BALMU
SGPGVACIQTSFLSSYRWCQKKQVSDLEEEGLWPELLDSGKTETCVSDWWTDQQYTDSLHGLTVRPLDANQAVLKSFSSEASHVFSNLQKVVRFVSFDHLVRDTDFWSGQYGVYLSHSSVTVRAHLP